MNTLYLAGPMTGVELANFPAFDEAATRLRKMGWHVISPADLNRINGFHEYRQAIDDKQDRADMLGTDISHLDGADAIALLPGWQHSDGVFAELAFARLKSMPVFDSRNGRQLDWRVVWKLALNTQSTKLFAQGAEHFV